MTQPQSNVAPNTCDHAYEVRILGGHPLSVRLCTLCRRPDWADLYEQADSLFRWGREEGLAGKPPRARLSHYDRPTEKSGVAEKTPAELREQRARLIASTGLTETVLRERADAHQLYPEHHDIWVTVEGIDMHLAELVAEQHVYLSTGCLHGEHAYCQSMTGQQGEKRPGRCKFCDARCTCPCHGETGAEG